MAPVVAECVVTPDIIGKCYVACTHHHTIAEYSIQCHTDIFTGCSCPLSLPLFKHLSLLMMQLCHIMS